MGMIDRLNAALEGRFLGAGEPNVRNYDVTPDGQRFILMTRPPERAPRRVVVVTHFFDELRALREGGTP